MSCDNAQFAIKRTTDSLLPLALTWVLLAWVGVCYSWGQNSTGSNRSINNSDAQSVTLRATRSAQAGHLEDAISLLRSFVLAHPSQIDVRLLLADLYARSGQTENAELEYREAVRLHPSSPDAKLALAEFENASGKLDQAETLLQKVIRTAPVPPSVYQLLAFVQAREHKYPQAQRTLAAVRIPSDHAARIAYLRLSASIESGLGHSTVAADTMQEALRLTPGDREIKLAAAVAEAQALQWQACVENVRPLFVERPTQANGLLLLEAQLATQQDFHSTLDVLNHLALTGSEELAIRSRAAQLLANSGKHTEAVEELQKAIAIPGSGSDLSYDLAVEQLRSGKLEPAYATVENLKLSGDSAELEDLAGDINEERKDYLAAAHAYQSAVALAPNEERYRLALGAELLRHGNYDAAALVFQQASSLFPHSPKMLIGLGMAQFFQQKDDDAVSSFLRAVDLGGTHNQAIDYVGMTQMEATDGPRPEVVQKVCGYADEHGSDASASAWCGALMFRRAFMVGEQSEIPAIVRRLQVAIRTAPQNPVAVCALGNALAWKQDWPAARVQLEECVRLSPDSAENHYRLGRVYAVEGYKVLAKEQFQLTVKANAQNDLRDTFAKKFIYQVSTQP